MTFKDIFDLFGLNSNETFEVDGERGVFVFRPKGYNTEVRLMGPNNIPALADVAFHMMATPSDVKKVRVFTQREKEDAELIMSLYAEDEQQQLSILKKEDELCYLVSESDNAAVLPCDFPTVEIGETWKLTYIVAHAEA